MVVRSAMMYRFGECGTEKKRQELKLVRTKIDNTNLS